ncbi:hypothetical protein [Halochromatium sp.]
MSYYAYPPGTVSPGQPSAQSPAQSPMSPSPMQGAQMQGGHMPGAPMGAGQTMQQPYAAQQPGMMPAGGQYANVQPAYHPMPMAPQAGAGAVPGAMPGMGYPTPTTSSFFNLGNDRFIKGLLIGAAAAYLLTNENVQRTAIKGVVKLWGGIQGGVEEIKERFHDAEAEIQASESHKDA